jgi:hypothetical protein
MLTKKSKYVAVLLNKQKACFDNGSFNNMKKLKAWARDRGGEYSLLVSNVKDSVNFEERYKIKHNKIHYESSGFQYLGV